jgi:cytochrome P450
LIGNAVLCLDAHPDAMDDLRRQPELMPGAIEEVLRYASPVWRTSRLTTTVSLFDDVRVPAKAVVFAWTASANRDAAQFPEPERFDIRRSPNPHLAFGHGIHFCVGAPLARLEASIALPMLLERMPHLRRVPNEPIEVLGTRFLLGIKRLPVTFAPSPQYVASAGCDDVASVEAQGA